MVNFVVDKQQPGAAGKGVPAGFKLTEVGVIPKDWYVARLGDVCDLINGRGFKPYEWGFEGLPIIRIQNLNGSDEFNYYNGNYDPKIFIKHGQLLFAWSGSRGTSFGPHIWSGNDALLNYHTWKLLIKTPSLEEGYFYYILKNLTSKIEEMAHGASALVHTQKGEMEQFLIPLPLNKDEQIKISKSLSSIDALIIKLEKLLIKKHSIKAAAMQQLLTGKTRLPQFALSKDGSAKGYKKSELEVIPEDWVLTTIAQFTDCCAGGTPGTKVSAYWGGTHPWMSSGELHLKQIYKVADYITDEGLASSSTKYVPKNSVLVGLAGQGKTRGTVAINRIELCTNQSIAAIFPSEHHSTEFLFYNLDNRYEELRGLSTGDGSRGGLNLTIIRKLHLAFPPIEEQIAIAAILSDMDKEIQVLQQRLDKTRQLKQGMMQELLTGKTRLI